MTPSKPIIKYALYAILTTAIVVAAVVVFKNKNSDQAASLAGVTVRSTGISVAPITTKCTRLSSPSIQVTSPNGGETYVAGQQTTVSWKSCNVTGNVIVTLIQPHNGGFSAWILSNSHQNSGQGTFTLPTASQWGNMIYGNNFKIKIGDVQSNETIQDQSDNLFTINGPVVADPCAAVSRPVVVAVDSTTPPTGTYNAGSAGNDFAHFRVTAACPVTITGLVTGKSRSSGSPWNSGNPPASNYKFYEGNTLLGSDTNGTLTAGMGGFNSFQMAAGQSKIITVKLDLTPQTVEGSLRLYFQAVGHTASNIPFSLPASPVFANWFKVKAGGVALCPHTTTGRFSVTLNAQSPAATTYSPGMTGVEFGRFDLKNLGTGTFCYNGIQIGSPASPNNQITNIKVIDVASGSQIGQTMSGLSNNGSYHYGWAQPVPSIPVAAGAIKTFKIIADILPTAPVGTQVQLGKYGMNFDSPGASNQGSQINLAAVMNIQ